jgi:hypothetical protein
MIDDKVVLVTWILLLAGVSAVGLMTDFEKVMGIHFVLLLSGVITVGILSNSM